MSFSSNREQNILVKNQGVTFSLLLKIHKGFSETIRMRPMPHTDNKRDGGNLTFTTEFQHDAVATRAPTSPPTTSGMLHSVNSEHEWDDTKCHTIDSERSCRVLVLTRTSSRSSTMVLHSVATLLPIKSALTQSSETHRRRSSPLECN